MLNDGFEGWIESLGEREFDATFSSLLRASRFFDIHYTHGGYEFGKDFIAKREENGEVIQYGIQCKAGDVAGSTWSQILGQMYELIDKRLVHPNYDTELPRRHVLCSTGRLKGKAIQGARSFRERVQEAGDGDFLIWDIDSIKDMLGRADGLVVSPTVSRELTQILATIESRPHFSERELESILARISPDEQTSDVSRSIFETTIVASDLARKKRPFHALTTVLHELRLAACQAHRPETTENAEQLIHDALARYVEVGQEHLLDLISCAGNSEDLARKAGVGFGAFATYPLTCLRLLEYLGLSTLISWQYGDTQRAAERLEQCCLLVHKQPGCCRPVSDRSATSIVPPVIALSIGGEKEAARTLLHRSAVWVCDRVEDGLGLASSYATPKQEIEQVFGAPFDFVTTKQRRESLAAVALADLAYVFCPELYPDIVNDFLAVGILPCGLFALDHEDAYFVGRGASRGMINLRYPEAASSGALPHHNFQPSARKPEACSGPVTMVALACLLRDRLFSDCYPRFQLLP